VISFLGIEYLALVCSSLHHMVICNGVSYVLNLGLGLQPFIYVHSKHKNGTMNSNPLHSLCSILDNCQLVSIDDY
jgi:hypothetical protein